MFTNLRVGNFKAIVDLEIRLSPLTVLVGDNSSGKTSLLQALDLLCGLTTRDLDEYLELRGWTFDDIRSQFAAEDARIAFELGFTSSDGSKLRWDISLGQGRDGSYQIREAIWEKGAPTPMLRYGYEDRWDGASQLSISAIENAPLVWHVDLKASVLKSIEQFEQIWGHAVDPRLHELKGSLSEPSSLGLLSPPLLRTRENLVMTNGIGAGGERLASYIHGFTPEQRKRLERIVSELIGYDVEVRTSTDGRPGWVDLSLVEHWGQPDGTPRRTVVDRAMLSDGLLRILALGALYVGSSRFEARHSNRDSATGGKTTFTLIDEVENGISPYVVGTVADLFKELAESRTRQVVMTSQSPVVSNYIDPDGLRFIWRDRDGMVHGGDMFSNEEMRYMLGVLGPGEVWLNYPKNDIVRMIQGERTSID